LRTACEESGVGYTFCQKSARRAKEKEMAMKPKSMTTLLMIPGLALLLAATVTVLGAQSAPAPAKPTEPKPTEPKPADPKPAELKPAEPGFKNLQVLKDVAPDQLLPTMQFVAASLGVDCQFCHVKDEFEKDDKKSKQIARQMMQMQMAINKENFEGRRVVSCYSCHRGSRDPVAVPVIPDEEPKPADAANAKPKDSTPRTTSDQILDKYLQAVGGADAMKQVVSRVEKGNMTFPGGQFPVEVFAKAPDKRISVAHTPGGDQMTAFDGHSGWLGSSARPPRDMTTQESAAFRLDADFNFAADLKQIFTQFRAARPEKVGDSMADVVIAVRPGQPPVRLYFDQESGLLVRMVRYADTLLGRNPTQIDYADYRDTGGIKIPYRWTVARTNGRFTIQIDQVQQNVAIDDSKFAKPTIAAAPAPPAGKAPAGHN
jgi:hypothetical protein